MIPVIATGLAFIKHYRFFLIAGLVLVVVVAFYARGCRSVPKLDEAAVQKAQKAIAEGDRKQMIEVLATSDVAEKQIDTNLANAENEKLKAFHEARKNAEALSNDELAKELERRAKQ